MMVKFWRESFNLLTRASFGGGHTPLLILIGGKLLFFIKIIKEN